MNIQIDRIKPSSPFFSLPKGDVFSSKKEAKTLPAKKTRGKIIGKDSPKSSFEKEKEAKKLINDELEALAKIQALLLQLTQKLSQNQIKMTEKVTTITVKNLKNQLQKLVEAKKKLAEAKKKQKEMKTIGIIVTVFAGLLAAVAGVEAMIAMAALTAMQYSGAMDKMTEGMNSGEKVGVSLAIGVGMAALTGGVGAAMFAEGLEEGAEGAALEELEVGVNGTRSEAAIKAAKFGGSVGTMQTLMSTGVLQNLFTEAFKKMGAKGETAQILAMITAITLAMAVIAAGASSYGVEGGTMGQIERLLGTEMPSTFKSMSLMLPYLFTAGTAGAGIGEGATRIEYGQIQMQNAKIQEEMAPLLKEQSILKFAETLLDNIEKMSEQNLSSYGKNFALQTKNLSSISLGYEALARVLEARAV